MREKKYTAGPWVCSNLSKQDGLFVVSEQGEEWAYHCRKIMTSDEKKVVGESCGHSPNPVGGYKSPATLAETVANAHLISAAPELLEALENMVLVAEGRGKLIVNPWDAVEKAKAAIAKAYGEEE